MKKLHTFSDFRATTKKRYDTSRLDENLQISSLMAKTDDVKLQLLQQRARKFYSTKDTIKKLDFLMDSLLISSSLGWSADAD